jgi:2,3-bisphosphoglycerate-dependent phosphoglycerate mutase
MGPRLGGHARYVQTCETASSPNRRLWLVRHGESTWNAAGLVQGQTAIPGLTAHGVRQARRCAAVLAGERVAALYSSDLRRALQTARPIERAKHRSVVEDSRLRERSYGCAEGTPSALLGPDRSGIDRGRVVDADAHPTGGESVRDLYRRAVDAVSEILAQDVDGDIVLVCHGGVVRVLLAWFDGTGPDAMAWRSIGNGLVISRPARVPSELHHAGSLSPRRMSPVA